MASGSEGSIQYGGRDAVVEDGKVKMEVAVDSKFIVTENLMVQRTNEDGDTLHFIKIDNAEGNNSSTANDDQGKKYAAMKALGLSAAYWT
eukprot:scaffold35635_cov73-Cyclotella_meneghiniana.AAC.1